MDNMSAYAGSQTSSTDFDKPSPTGVPHPTDNRNTSAGTFSGSTGNTNAFNRNLLEQTECPPSKGCTNPHSISVDTALKLQGQLPDVQDKNLNNEGKKVNGIIFIGKHSVLQGDPFSGVISKAHEPSNLLISPENDTYVPHCKEDINANQESELVKHDGLEGTEGHNGQLSSFSDNSLLGRGQGRDDERSSSWIDLRSNDHNISRFDSSPELSCTEQILKRIYEQFEQPLKDDGDPRPYQDAFLYTPQVDSMLHQNKYADKESALNEVNGVPANEDASSYRESFQNIETAPYYKQQNEYRDSNINGWNLQDGRMAFHNVTQTGTDSDGTAQNAPYTFVWDPYTGQVTPIWGQGYGPSTGGYQMPYTPYYYGVCPSQFQNNRTDPSREELDYDERQHPSDADGWNNYDDTRTNYQEEHELLSDGTNKSNELQPIERKLSNISNYDEKPIINFNHTIQQESERFSSSSDEERWEAGDCSDWEAYFQRYGAFDQMDIELDYMYGGGAEDYDSIAESSIEPGSSDQSLDEEGGEEQGGEACPEERPPSEDSVFEENLRDEDLDPSMDDEEREMHLLRRYQVDIDSGRLRPLYNRRHCVLNLADLNMEQLLCEGVFSAVFKATHGETPMAVSIYPREADLYDFQPLMNLRSSFINKVLHCVKSGPDIWLLHKYFHLGDLASLLECDQRRDVFGEIHAQFVVAGLFMAVDYLHRHGIVHGNIHPSKVLINDLGYPVLTGFRNMAELVRSNEGGEKENDREAQHGCHSFALLYASPERLEGLHYEGKTDSFSIGCIAYEIITGWSPFESDTEAQIVQKILDQNFRPHYGVDVVSFGGEKFIEHCLQRDPEARFHTGIHMANLLREEWFSSLNLKRIRKQLEDSPLCEVFRLLATGERLIWEEKSLNHDWGRVMDVVCPHRPSLPQRPTV